LLLDYDALDFDFAVLVLSNDAHANQMHQVKAFVLDLQVDELQVQFEFELAVIRGQPPPPSWTSTFLTGVGKQN
jgi:hypothetical protein